MCISFLKYYNKYLELDRKRFIFGVLKRNKMTTELKVLVESRSRRIAGGEVLTTNLFNRVNRAAFQYGGLFLKGEYKVATQTIFDRINKANRTIVLIEKSLIKGSPELFLRDFEKTMNASIFQIELV